jgi:hypothetical protein
MKPIERSEILGLAEYEQIRERFRSRVIGEKKVRRVQIGPNATAVFENRDTVLLQIQAAVQHELDTYNESLPVEDELSCTLMIEIAEKEEREAFLRDALGFEAHVWLVAGGERILARALDRGAAPDRTTAVHYLKFKLPAQLATSLRQRATAMSFEIDHPVYQATAPLSAETIASLREDLQA